MKKLNVIISALQRPSEHTALVAANEPIQPKKPKPKKKQKGNSWDFYPMNLFQKPPPDPMAKRSPYIPIPQRITIAHIEGDNTKNCFATNYSSLEILLGGQYVPGKFLPMLDFYGDRFDDTTYGASAGIVNRIIPKEGTFCRMLGFNLFYDYRQGNIG